MAVIPEDLHRIVPHRLHVRHFDRRLEHLERVRARCRIVCLLRLGAMRAGAYRAGALVAQIAQAVIAMVAVLPIDLNAFRFGDGNVFRIVAIAYYLLNPLDISYARNAADRARHFLKLALVFNLYRHFHNRSIAVVLLVGTRFQAAYITALGE